MAYKYGCDMRGMFSFQIMWLLSKKPMHGEELARQMERRRGDKPKAGTLYPALKELRTARLIKGSKTGRLITYSLTPLGKAALKQAVKYFCRSFGDVFVETSR
jgi:DNA-binding PadR family transcriptional regulator